MMFISITTIRISTAITNVIYKRVGHISEWATFHATRPPLPKTPSFFTTKHAFDFK